MTKTYSHTKCTTNSSKETSIQHIKIVESQGNTVVNFFFQATATTLLTEGLFFPLLLAPFPGNHVVWFHTATNWKWKDAQPMIKRLKVRPFGTMF